MKRMHLDSKTVLHLYHGSKSGIIGNVAPISRSNCDFGKAFYMGDSEKQAFSFVCFDKYPDRKFYRIDFDITDLSCITLDFIPWMLAVSYNRGYLDDVKDSILVKSLVEYLSGYDVIIGKIADDNIFKATLRFFEEDALTDYAFYKAFTDLSYGIQYAAVTEKACSKIKLCEIKLPDYTVIEYKKFRSKTKDDGDHYIDTMPIEYKRIGRYWVEYFTHNIFDKEFCALPKSFLDFKNGRWF